MSKRFVSLVFLLAALAAPAQASALEQQLLASDGAANDRLGTGVAVEGDTAVVGAAGDDANRGAVYVYTRTGNSWAQTAKLTAGDGAPGDNLGASVAIDGDTIVAGASGDDGGRGSVYTFSRTGQTAKLTAGDGVAQDRLGTSVAIDGDTIVAGAPGAAGARGSAYTFTRGGAAGRSDTAELNASDEEASNRLGAAVAIVGNTIVAGAPGEFASRGCLYSFTRAGDPGRVENAKLIASDRAAGDQLGASVAADGATIVAGAFGDDAEKGAAYTFASSGGNRSQVSKLTASDGVAGRRFAGAVAISGAVMAVGAPFDTVGANARQGSVYQFTGGAQTGKLAAAGGAPQDVLGSAVGVDGSTIIAGDFVDDVGANPDQGSASIFYAAGGGGAGGGIGGPFAPTVSGFTLSPKKLLRGRTGKFLFKLATNASVRIRVEREVIGERQGKKCVTLKRNSTAKQCIRRFVFIKTLTVNGKAGANSVLFKTKNLPAGTYRASLTAVNSSLRRTATLTFKLRAKRRK